MLIRSIKDLILIILISLLLIKPCLAADDVSIELRLDRTEATITDDVRMTISVSGARKIDSNPQFKGLDSFDVIQGGTSSRVQIVNGRMNSSIEYNYILRPRDVGDYSIGPAQVKVGKKSYESNSVRLKITELKRTTGENRGPLFLSASLSSKKVYVGDQTIYILKLYRKVNVRDISLRLPEADHLSFKQLGKPVEYQSQYNNETYHVLEVRYSLIPSEEGTYGIRSSRMDMTVLQSRRGSPFDMFDDSFFSSMTGQQKSIASEPLELNVLPLPEKGRPNDYSGLVGSFDIDATMEPSKLKAGESATLTVVVKGRGDVKHIPDLNLQEPDQIKIYSDQPVLKEDLDSNGIKGSKTMKWALVPEEEGEYQVPQLSVSYFDTQKAKYQTLTTTPFTLSVQPGENEKLQAFTQPSEEQTDTNTNKKEIKELGRDILPVHSSVKDFYSGLGVKNTGILFWILMLAPFIIYIGTFIGLRTKRQSISNASTIRAKRAAKNLIRRTCETSINSRELILAFQDYFNEKLDLTLGTLTAIDAEKILLSKNVSESTAQEFRNLIQRFEDNVYTGKGDETCETQDEIKTLIKKLEKELK
jgi:hypothetical protein